MDKTLEHLRKEEGFTEEDLQDIDEVMSLLIPEPFIDCRFCVEVSVDYGIQVFTESLVRHLHLHHLQSWSERDIRTVFGYIGKPLSDSLNIKDHIIAAKEMEAELNAVVKRQYGDRQETYVHIQMEYSLNYCEYRFNVEDHGNDNPQAENTKLGDCEPLPHWSLLRVCYTEKVT